MGFLGTSSRIRKAIIEELPTLPDHFVKTLAQGVADYAVGQIFSSAETGATRRYERIAAAPGYRDMGDEAAPPSRATVLSTDAPQALSDARRAIGRSNLGLGKVENSTDAEKVEGGPISEALGQRPTHDDLAKPEGAGFLGWKLAASQGVTRSQAGKNEDFKNFADFAYSGDKSNNRAFADMIEYLGGITPVGGNNRYTRKPTIHFAEGATDIEYDAPFNVQFRALSLKGFGPQQTALRCHSTSDIPFIDIGTFLEDLPENVYDGEGSQQDIFLRGLRLQLEDSGPIGARRGQAIRQTRGGGLILREVSVNGFKYGINSVCGGDFSRLEGVTVEYCDVGVYIGPGAQQVTSIDLNLFFCEEALVLDRVNEARFYGNTFNSPGKAGVVIECLGPTKTRQLKSFPASGTSQDNMVVFTGNWWETGAGGHDHVPDYFVEFRSDATQPDAYRGITFQHNKVLVAPPQTKELIAFLGKTGAGPGGQRVEIHKTSVEGNMRAVHSALMGNVDVQGWRTANGYVPAKISDGFVPASSFRIEDRYARRRRQGAMPFDEEITNIPAGSRTEVRGDYPADWTVALRRRFTGTKVSWSSWNTAIPGYDPAQTAGFDLSRRLMTLSDPEAVNPLALGVSASQPSGAYAAGSFVFGGAPVVAAMAFLGYQKLTSGTGTAINVDLLPVFGKTKAFDDAQDAVLDNWGAPLNTRGFIEVRNAGAAPTPRPTMRGIQPGGTIGFSLDPNTGISAIALNLYKRAVPGGLPSNGWQMFTDTATGKISVLSETAYGTDLRTIHVIRSGSKQYDPPSIPSGTSISTNVTVTGAKLGDKVVGISHSTAGFGGLLVSGSITAAGNAAIVLANLSGAAIDLADGMLSVDVATT